MKYKISPEDALQNSGAGVRFEPKEVLYYSTDADLNDYFEDDRSLRYFNPPRRLKHNNRQPIYDLSKGYKQFKSFSYDRSVPRSNSLLEAVRYIECKHEKKISGDFITNRGILLDIIYMVNEKCSKSFEFNVIKFDGQIFISDTDYRDNEVITGVNHQKAIYSGYNFENIITSPECDKRFPLTVVKNNNSTFKSIIDLSLGNHKIIIRSETDCAMKPRKDCDNPLSNYLELKTHLHNSTNTQGYYNKLFKTYYQCKICGIQQFIIGFRSSSFKLLHLSEFKVNLIQLANNFMRGEDWLDHVLTWVRQTIESEGGDYWKLKVDRLSRELVLIKIDDETIKKEMFYNGIGDAFKDHRFKKEYIQKDLSEEFSELKV